MDKQFYEDINNFQDKAVCKRQSFPDIFIRIVKKALRKREIFIRSLCD